MLSSHLKKKEIPVTRFRDPQIKNCSFSSSEARTKETTAVYQTVLFGAGFLKT